MGKCTEKIQTFDAFITSWFFLTMFSLIVLYVRIIKILLTEYQSYVQNWIKNYYSNHNFNQKMQYFSTKPEKSTSNLTPHILFINYTCIVNQLIQLKRVNHSESKGFKIELFIEWLVPNFKWDWLFQTHFAIPALEHVFWVHLAWVFFIYHPFEHFWCA